jgi:hypothetical protein
LSVNNKIIYHRVNSFELYKKQMKRLILLLLLFSFCWACGPKPAYKTAEGKRRQKYYNNLQFGGDPQAVPPPKTKKKN